MRAELLKKEKTAIERLKAFEPANGYYIAYSGGKDSDCIRILAELADVKRDLVHNLTSVDAPETVRYVKSIPDVEIEKPRYADGERITMWNLIVKKGTPPMRLSRYCCSNLKESGGKDRITVTGVRWTESSNRKEHSDVVQLLGKPKSTQKLADEYGAEYRVTRQGALVMNDDNDENRRMVEHCYRTRKTMVNPIVDWTDEDVWDFLKHYGCESNPLYKCGFKRIGCIGCPMASKKKREKEFIMWPKYKEAYIRAFDRMIRRRIERGIARNDDEAPNWKTGEDVMNWWLNI